MPELSAGSLRNFCDESCLNFQTTADLPPLRAIIGQDRAVQSLEFGLGIRERGYNIYAAGQAGTGKTTAITEFLQERAASMTPPSDWCYVQNFRDPNHPRVIQLPRGTGRALQRDMRRLVEEAQRNISQSLESTEISNRKEEILQEFRRERENLFGRFNERARLNGFLVQTTTVGLTLVPHRDGRPLSNEELASLSPEQRDLMTQTRHELEGEMKQVFDEVHRAERRAHQGVQQLDREIIRFDLDILIRELKGEYDSLPQVEAYLNDVEADMAENADMFRSSQQQAGQPQALTPASTSTDPEHAMHRYEVNVIVDNSETSGAPVVHEVNPTYNNLMGRVDKEARYGALYTDFTMIRPGSLHRANGGYLIIRIEEILRNPASWEALKRSLREQKIMVEEMAERMGFVAVKGLTPEPIPLDVKTVLIGDANLYHMLFRLDPEFPELFRVKAEFDSTMERTEANVLDYASFVCALCTKEGLLPMDREGVSKLVEHGSRLAEDQNKLSTRFAAISDVIREASYFARQDGAASISAGHVRKALDEKMHRSDLIRDKIVEMIQRGTIAIDTEGAEVGQINGLAVLSLGDFSFGRPGRITVSVGAGREGLVDIEREARLGGRLHTKGVMILAGYIADRLARDVPLSLVARLTFEQSYEEIEGDSASSAELYAILSRLADLPIRQGIAVTGSVNQKGQVQPIGGVNQKVEGFFEVCQAKGLTGDQGVLVPAANVPHLMLREEVVEAVRDGRFHVYSAETIDEGIELLTGVSAGCLLPDGTFEEGTVNGRVSDRLAEMARNLRDFMRSDDRLRALEGEGVGA
ncbi:MAG: ATP-binding protein [Chloroflexota bacterium]|nr:ATP-binding protein [Chloroflexota bacterium]MDE2941937.1 ATP-binding protein [Chloroflexota bacterium]MDE3268626.1 ATP-binding protein [Chloroflexota bacterium]